MIVLLNKENPLPKQGCLPRYPYDIAGRNGSQVQSVANIIRPIAIEAPVVKPTIAIDDKEIDLNLEQYKHLIDPQWKAWHAKWIKKNGLSRWVQNAKIAEQDGKDKPRYFTWLLTK